MEELKYIIEDSTIAELLGVQNFTNDESAILELIKNSYDAGAKKVELIFESNNLTIIDDGVGMSEVDIKNSWMHIGKSSKKYEAVYDDKLRILAGSKGIGRFALARLAKNIKVYSKKENYDGIVWISDWQGSTIEANNSIPEKGTKIFLSNLRERWNKNKIKKLVDFLSKTYNDNKMKIEISGAGIKEEVKNIFPTPTVGENCKSIIKLHYNSKNTTLDIQIYSGEFSLEAQKICNNIDLVFFKEKINIVDELKYLTEINDTEKSTSEIFQHLGDFTAELYFNINPSKVEREKFLYKTTNTESNINAGIILYRNAFSIASFEGDKDWLGLGKRTRKSPAAASHPTGSWRVRENQLSGKIQIDKKANIMLQDLSNRQGIDENIYYFLFVQIILTGITEFERYRQNIIRKIAVENKLIDNEEQNKSIVTRVAVNPKEIHSLSTQERDQLVNEIIFSQEQNKEYVKNSQETESRYKYDVRILNVLATTGLKASSIAHEMRNDKNIIKDNTVFIIEALKKYKMWESLISPDYTKYSHQNIPRLLDSNRNISSKIIMFMNVIMSDIQKKQFSGYTLNIKDSLIKIKSLWEHDYSWISVSLNIADDLTFFSAEDIIKVIFDNLILNSIQHNEKKNKLSIQINAIKYNNLIQFEYKDDGVGLASKYISNPYKILEVHETTRQDGHGLGMWIINNTLQISGGVVQNISTQAGFSIEFTLGDKV